MSFSVSAVELQPDVDVFTFAPMLAAKIKVLALRSNTENILVEEIARYDYLIETGELDVSYERFSYDLAREEPYKDRFYVEQPFISFKKIEERLFMFCSAKYRGALPEILGEDFFNDVVVQDYSFYNATDAQVADGELTNAEWRERSDFWYANLELLMAHSLGVNVLDGSHIRHNFNSVINEILSEERFSDEARRMHLARRIVFDRRVSRITATDDSERLSLIIRAGSTPIDSDDPELLDALSTLGSLRSITR